MEKITLEASERKISTKGSLRKLRSEGLLPGIIYGSKEKSQPLSLKKITIKKLLENSNFMSSVIEITINGVMHKVLTRDIEFHPLNNEPLHIDFQKIKSGTKITVFVPIKFINQDTCPGLKLGGVLNIVRRKIELKCPAENIPTEIIVDLAGKEMNESIHISAIKLPENVKPTITDRDFTIATVAAPTVVKEPEPAAATEGTPVEGTPAEGTPAEGASADPKKAAGNPKKGAAADPKKTEAAKPASGAAPEKKK